MYDYTRLPGLVHLRFGLSCHRAGVDVDFVFLPYQCTPALMRIRYNMRSTGRCDRNQVPRRILIQPDPLPSRPAGCADRCELTHRRLNMIDSEVPVILISHYPGLYDLVDLPVIPRLSLRCAIRQSENYPRIVSYSEKILPEIGTAESHSGLKRCAKSASNASRCDSILRKK